MQRQSVAGVPRERRSILIALCLLGGCGFAQPDRTVPAAALAFHNAKREDTIEAYEAYIAAHPDAGYSREARLRSEALRRQKAIDVEFANSQASDLGVLLKKYAFHSDAWRPAIQLMKRTWVAVDADLSQLIKNHLRPMLPTEVFGAVRGDLTSFRGTSTAVFRGVNGDRFQVYCEELVLDGKSLGPIIYHFQLVIYRMRSA